MHFNQVARLQKSSEQGKRMGGLRYGGKMKSFDITTENESKNGSTNNQVNVNKFNQTHGSNFFHARNPSNVKNSAAIAQKVQMNLNRKTEVYQTQKNLELLKLCELDNLKEASTK